MFSNIAKILFLGILCCILAETILAESWNGVIPLKTTRDEIEKRLGLNENGFYLVNNDKVRIFYSSEPYQMNICDNKCPKDLVTYISVHIERPLKIDELNLDMSKFKKVINSNQHSRSTYSNLEDGISYSVFEEDNEVLSIHYFPSKKNCQSTCNSKCNPI